MTHSAGQIAHLRKLRSRPGPNLSISKLIASVAADASRSHKRMGELIRLWEELVPDWLAAQTSLTSFRAGVLHVSVESSSAMFELDRLLRSGLFDQLREQFRGTLVRVKTRISA